MQLLVEHLAGYCCQYLNDLVHLCYLFRQSFLVRLHRLAFIFETIAENSLKFCISVRKKLPDFVADVADEVVDCY